MSWEATAHVWQHSKASGTDLLVLLAIANSYNEAEGYARPSVNYLAKRARSTPRSIQRHRANLVALGELRVEERARPNGSSTSSRYYLPGHTADVDAGGEGDGTVAPPVSQVSPLDPKSDPSGTDVPDRETPPVKSSSDSRPRQRNPLFDTLASVCGIHLDEITPPQAKRVGTALALIKKAREAAGKELRVGDIEARARRYRAKYRHASLTPTALAAHWAELGPSSVPIPDGGPSPGAAGELGEPSGYRSDGRMTDAERKELYG